MHFSDQGEGFGRKRARAHRRPVGFVAVAACAAFLFVLATPSASGSPAGDSSRLRAHFNDLWTTVLETPTPENPFTGGSTCVALDGNVVSPFGPDGAPDCTVDSGVKVFVAGYTWECSSFPGDHFDYATTNQGLRSCAKATFGDRVVTGTLDGSPLALTEVETSLLPIKLPVDNIFGVATQAERKGRSVGYGSVTLVSGLTSGDHSIRISVENGGTVREYLTTIHVR